MSNYLTQIQKTICDENGVELIITVSDSEDGYTLEAAELIIAGKGIDITKSLNHRQVQKLLSRIEREDFLK